MQNLTCHLQDYCFSAPAEDRESRAVQPTGAEGLSRLGDGGKIVCFTIHIVNLHASELRSLMIHFQMIHQLIPAPNYPPAHSARDKMLEVVNSFLLLCVKDTRAKTTGKFLVNICWQAEVYVLHPQCHDGY